MPELPEVETIKRRLAEQIVGKQISQIEVFRTKSFQGDPDQIMGQTITAVHRYAKMICFHLAERPALLIHLKMTGQLIYKDGDLKVGGGHPTSDWIGSLPSKHTRAKINFTDQTTLFFNDQRVFGWIKIIDQETLAHELRNYGPDVTDSAVTPTFLWKKFQSRKIPVKLAIMDHKLISGVGNIYANDGLNLAKIDPRRPAQSLTKTEVRDLHRALLEVINSGIALGGASIKDYLNIDGLSGGYQNVVRVYQKEGQPCPNCGHELVRIKQGGRGTFYCPNCQK